MGGIISRMGIGRKKKLNQRIKKQTAVLEVGNGNNNNNNIVSKSGPTISQPRQLGPTILQQRQLGPASPSLFNRMRGKEKNINRIQLTQNNKLSILSYLQKPTTFVLQRHATSCANILNKGFKEGSTSLGKTKLGKVRLVAEIAPDSMLSSIGVDECNQVHDYLTNEGKDITNIDSFDYLFCCSELIRTQQTMFLSYFDLIRSKKIKIMILPWLNEEHAIGGMNKDNLTIFLSETKRRWASFIIKYFSDNEELINKYFKWDDVFYLPDFIYRNPSGPNASFDKRIDLERLYKIKMKESCGIKGKCSYSAEDLLFALPFILHFRNTPNKSPDKTIKIFMTGHNGSMKKLVNLITLRSVPDLRTKTQKSINFIKRTGEQLLYYSKPYLEKQQIINGEIISLKPILFSKLIDINDIKQFYNLNNEEIKSISMLLSSLEINSEFKFDSCRRFPVGFSEQVISKEMLTKKTFMPNKLSIKKIHPFYFFSNDNLGIIYSLVDIVKQKIKTENDILYKEDYPLRVFFSMTLLQYIGYLMVAKVVVSTMKNEFKINPKYDYQGLLTKIEELQNKIYIYVDDTGNIRNVKKFNVNNNQQPQPQPQSTNSKPKQQSNTSATAANKQQSTAATAANKQKSTANSKQQLQQLKLQQLHQQQQQLLLQHQKIIDDNEHTEFGGKNIRKIINEYLSIKYKNKNILTLINIDDDINNILQLENFKRIDKKTIEDLKICIQNKIIDYLLGQHGGQAANTDIQYMEKNEKVYFDKVQQFPKYSTTIKQYLFETLPELKNIQDRQEKRKKFVELLHKSLLSKCDIKSNQQNKITDFMKNSFPTGLLEQDSQTPTRENKIKGQVMLERVEKLNTKTGINISRINAEYGNIRIPIIIPFIPLDKDGNNQLDKIIQHMKNMGGIYTSPNHTKDTNFIQIYADINRLTIKDTLKFIYPSINDSVINYIISYIYKINITFANSNLYYSQTTRFFYDLLILFYSNYGIQYIFDNYKNMAIMFSIIENFSIDIGRILLETESKKNFSLILYRCTFISLEFLNLELYKKTHKKYTKEEIIKNIKRCYYYTIYKNTEYYEKYGLCFFYFSLYIPDLIYYMSDNMELNIDMNTTNGSTKFINILSDEKLLMNYYKKKVEYLFNLSDIEIKEQGEKVINYFMTKFHDNIIKLKSSNYHILSKSRKLNTNKLYVDFINNINPYEEQHGPNGALIIKKEYYTITEYTEENYKRLLNKLTPNPRPTLTIQAKLEILIGLITKPVHFESNEKAIATISGIPAKFEQSLISPHFFAFEFNLNKIKEVCSNGLVKFSKKDCIQFVKGDIKNIMIFVKELFQTETDIWKYFVEIQIHLIKEGYVFVSPETNTIIYISRLFGSSFDSILEIFYQSFPYMMFCFEYFAKIAYNIYNIRISPCQFLNELFNTIGLEKMIILYKYLNITNIEIMEYIKKYGIIFLIYALLTPFHIYQTELTGKNITSQKQIIINKLKAIDKFEIVKNIKPVFDNNKIVEFIQKVKEKKNDIFGKIPLVVPQINNSNINSFNVSKFSNNGIKYNEKIIPSSPAGSNNETKGQNADFIWSVFTVPVPV